MNILSRFLVLFFMLSSGCRTEMDKCMIGEYNGYDPTIAQVVAHINSECIRRHCAVRAVANDEIVNRKIVGKVKIGKGSLTMFLQGVKGTFNCDAKLEKNRLIFY